MRSQRSCFLVDKLDQLLADAKELLKLSPEEMARVYRERQLIKAREIANAAAVADAKIANKGRWYNAQKIYERSIIKQSSPPYPKRS